MTEYDKYKDDQIVRLAFKLWHTDRLNEYSGRSPESKTLGFWPSVFTDFISLSDDIKNPYLDRAAAEYRNNNIEKIIKKDE